MRVVVDTGVWVASTRCRRGASFALLSEISHNRFQFGISVPLYYEYQEQLHEAVASEMQVDSILSALAFYGVEVPIYLRDESDHMVFECAANFGASNIITNDVRGFPKPELEGYETDDPHAFAEALAAVPDAPLPEGDKI